MQLCHIQALGQVALACPRDIHLVAHKAVPAMVAELGVLDARACANDEVRGRKVARAPTTR
jgi:hypothetical protein